MSKLAENLKKLMQIDNLSSSELARRTGISQSVINRIMNGVTINPNIATLGPIASFFSVNISELISNLNSLELSAQSTYLPTARKPHQVPVISWDEATEWGGCMGTTKRYQFITTDKGTTETAFALMIKDDLDSRFPTGTFLIIEPTKKFKNRDYVIAQKLDESVATLKRIIFDGTTAYLKPIDPDFKTVELTKAYQVIGVVIQSIYNFDQ